MVISGASAALGSLPVQMMLTWSLADALRRKVDPAARIDHWVAGLSHGLALRSSIRNVSVTIGYHGVLTFWDDADHIPQIPDVWDAIQLGALTDPFVVHVAGHLLKAGRSGAAAAARADERAVAYECLAALLRLSVQRGFGWRCDTALDDEWWGPVDALLSPYAAHVDRHVSSEAISDWSFVHGPAGPVCAVDPEHRILFPDETVWPLLEVTEAAPWRVAWAIANRTAATGAVGPALGLQHLAAGAMDGIALWRHEAQGGKVVDHRVFGPTPILSTATRRTLSSRCGLRIPESAVVAHGHAVHRVLAAFEQHSLFGGVRIPPSDSFELLVAWDRFIHAGKSQPAGLIGVADRDGLAYEAVDALTNVANLASQIWQQHTESAIVWVDGVIQPSAGFAWSLAEEPLG